MTSTRSASVILAVVSLAAGIGLLLLTAGDGVVTGERGPRLGEFVDGNLLAALVFLAGGLLAAVGAYRVGSPSGRVTTLAAGGLLMAGALLHLIGIAVGVDLLGGSGSTVAAYLGLGGALLAIGLTTQEAVGKQPDDPRP